MFSPSGLALPAALPNILGQLQYPILDPNLNMNLQLFLLMNARLRDNLENQQKQFQAVIETNACDANLHSPPAFSIHTLLDMKTGSTSEEEKQEPSTPSCSSSSPVSSATSDVVAYTLDALETADGRTKRKKMKSEAREEKLSGRCVCEHCGKSYATSSNLSRHKQTHRSLDSPFAKQCPHCDRVYVSMPALSMHILTHKAAHVCDVCGKVFSRLWLLQGHMRSHTGHKPFGCAQCGKSFADRSNLRAHILTHTGDKKFECSMCGKRFALRSYLNRHMEQSCLNGKSTPTEESRPSRTPTVSPPTSSTQPISGSSSASPHPSLPPTPPLVSGVACIPNRSCLLDLLKNGTANVSVQHPDAAPSPPIDITL